MLRKLLFREYYRVTGRGHVLREVDTIDQEHFLTRPEIEEKNSRRMHHILRHAASTVPFYRELLGGVGITEATVWQHLQGLPPMTKRMIRKEGDRLFSEKPGKKVRWNTSGGSTGEPIRLKQDEYMAHRHRSGELLYMRWAGHELGSPHVLIWGVPQETVGKGISTHEKVFRFICNQTYLNCYRISDSELTEWIKVINRVRPAVIEAYVDAIYDLSVHILRHGCKVNMPRGIIASAGVLTEERRKTISEAFGCPILNRYGSREVSNVACSCQLGTELHVNESWAYLEIVNDFGSPCEPGEEGNILVTLYWNKTMPLIRYRIEDRGAWAPDGKCVCGRTTRRLIQVCGRMNDFLVAGNGTKINGTALTTLLYEVDGIRRYQYKQSVTGEITLIVEPELSSKKEVLTRDTAPALAKLRELVPGRQVNLEIVKEIPPSNSGKYRYIVNEMAGLNLPIDKEKRF